MALIPEKTDELKEKQDELIEWLSDNLFHKCFEAKRRELTLVTTKLSNDKMYHSPSNRLRIGTEFSLTK